MEKYLKYIFLYFASFVLRLFARQKKGLLLFSARGGANFEGNSRYLYLYAVKNTDYQCYWISKNKDEIATLHKNGINAIYYFTFTALLKSVQAEAVFITHSISDVMPSFYGWNTKIIDLWHGITIKKVSFWDKNLGFKSRLMDYLKSKRLSYYISNAKEFESIYERSFKLKKEKIRSYGYSRIEYLMEPSLFGLSHKSLLSNESETVLYCPTFRDYEYQNPLLESQNLIKLERELIENNLILYLKLHPEEKTPKIDCFERIRVIDSAVDIYELLPAVDILLSDYSSVVFDFLMAYRDRKLILFTPDLSKYERQRGFSIEFEKIFADYIVNSVQELDFSKAKKMSFYFRQEANCSERILSLLNENR